MSAAEEDLPSHIKEEPPDLPFDPTEDIKPESLDIEEHLKAEEEGDQIFSDWDHLHKNVTETELQKESSQMGDESSLQAVKSERVTPWDGSRTDCPHVLPIAKEEELSEEVSSYRSLSRMTRSADSSGRGAQQVTTTEATDKVSAEMSTPETKFGKKKFSCEICGKRYTTKGNLNQHVRAHQEGTPYACYTCGKKYMQTTTVKQHALKHHNNTKFTYKGVLHHSKRGRDPVPESSYRVTSSPEETYTCNECGKRFTDKGNVLQHIRTHSGAKPFDCPVCGKAYTRSSDVKRHAVTHTKQRNFKCDVCGKKFLYKGILAVHTRIHTGQREFSCSVCSKSFVQNAHLQLHMTTHTRPKNFSCHTCGKWFSDKGHLSQHLKRHHGE